MASSLQLLLTDYLALGKEAGRRNSDVRDVSPPPPRALSRIQLTKRVNRPQTRRTVSSRTRAIKLSSTYAQVSRFESSRLRIVSPALTWGLCRTSSIPSAALPAHLPCLGYQECQSHRVGGVELAATDWCRSSSESAYNARVGRGWQADAELRAQGLVRQILETLESVIPQGVEIQLKILQTLVSLLTTTVGGTGDRRGDRLVQGEELGMVRSNRFAGWKEELTTSPRTQALELSHRLSTSKIPVVASTASATLRQLFMFVFERVGEEDALVSAAKSSEGPALLAALPPATFSLDVPPPEHDAASPGISQEGEKKELGPTSISLRPAARDAYLLLEDLCLLIAGSADGGPEGEPSFLRWGSLSRTFGLELVESIVSGFGPVVRTVSPSLPLAPRTR